MKPQPVHSLTLGADAEPFIARLPGGRELRVLVQGPRATLSIWWPTPGGLASSGEVEVTARSLQWAIAVQRRAQWELERAEGVSR